MNFNEKMDINRIMCILQKRTQILNSRIENTLTYKRVCLIISTIKLGELGTP